MVSEIKPVDGKADVMKIIFSEGIVGAGLLGSNEPWYLDIVMGESKQIGVHHKEGVLMADTSFDRADLPVDICGLFDFILDHQGIAERSTGPSVWEASVTLSDAERSQIEETLRGLGYL